MDGGSGSAGRDGQEGRSDVVSAHRRADFHETLEQTCERIARLLENRKLVLAAAGGEQVVQNLFEIVSPEAANHIAAGAATLYKDGLVQLALTAATAGVPEALRQYSIDTGLVDPIQHGAGLHVVTGLPGHVADTLPAAGSHPMQGMHDIGHRLQHPGSAASNPGHMAHHPAGGRRARSRRRVDHRPSIAANARALLAHSA